MTAPKLDEPLKWSVRENQILIETVNDTPTYRVIAVAQQRLAAEGFERGARAIRCRRERLEKEGIVARAVRPPKSEPSNLDGPYLRKYVPAPPLDFTPVLGRVFREPPPRPTVSVVDYYR